ncbi:heterodisulfide reductase-related iron-sulfur binding cluster [Bacteriovoracaceae bacterium]|nr:heterodisulfide reductase-related iron-sulfur binding cluster [Bacteriovoracaceae bacterium]
MMSEVTRTIMWQIPTSFKISMYAMFFLAVGLMILGLHKKMAFILNGNKLSSLIPKKLNWKSFIETIFFTGKVTRNESVGIFHSMIYYGFAILTIATELVAIHADSPLKIYKGPVYIIVSFLADIAGIVILLGIGLAYKRRYIDKPDYLSATKPKQEKVMYALIVWLVVIGFLLEGLRISAVGFPEYEAFYSPIGFLTAKFIGLFGLSFEAQAGIYKGLWLIHMVNTMLFIVAIGHTKLSHIIFAPLSALITPLRRGAVLSPMDFEDESAETFGLGKSSEMTSKMRFDMSACVECGRCTQVCPANLAEKPLNPKTIITKARDIVLAKPGETVELWEGDQIYNATELDSCTTCGACMEECPMNIEHVNMIMELKRYKALTLGELPPAAADATNKIKINGNPWGIAQDDRFNWADGLEVPVITPEKKVDYLYYVGCAGSYDASNQKVLKDTIMLLKKAGVDFAVIGKTEKCNGDPIRRFGDEYSFFEIAIENIAKFNEYKFDKIVTHCPHCLHTIGKEYLQFEDGKFDVVHHTELLADLLKDGKLRPEKSVNEELTYHDPCYLGRHHGSYDAPREILNSIDGIQLKEMPKNKEKSLCCGMGGGNMWYEIDEGKHLAENRLEEIGEVKAPKLASACSFCLINFNSSKGSVKSTEVLEIEDVASILAKSIQD